MRALSWLLAAAIAFATGLAVFHFGMLAFVRSGAEAKIPDLVGMSVAEARDSLEEAGFAGVEERQEHSAEFGEGVILSHRPEAGVPVRKGRKVWLTTSLGLRRTATPNIAGLSYRQAGIVLDREGLGVGSVSRVHHAGVERGSVVAQDPPAGAPLPEGARVHLLVSLGSPPGIWVMPDLAGRPAQEVESMLQRQGLRVGDKTVVIDRSVLPGTVLEHEPAPGRRVEEGAEIALVISSRR